MQPENRRGILASGNFIVDRVKLIDRYPAEDMLATIHRESRSNGGGPFNVLKDLAAMQAGFPLSAVGVVGTDQEGTWIINDCQANGIDASQLHRTSERPTSYTDVMTVQSTGRRTFFHQRGANALFDGIHCDLTQSNARIFHLGYLMLLDRMDSFAEDGQTHAAHLLARVRAAGMITSLDIVSTEHPDFQKIALSALPHADHLIINEVEAARILARPVPASNTSALLAATKDLLQLGVQNTAVIHTEYGAVAAEKSGATHVQGSVSVPSGYIQGSNGAGDAFAAGYLYALHEGHPLSSRLELAVCTAAACLGHPTPSAGLRPVGDCLAFGRTHGFRPLA